MNIQSHVQGEVKVTPAPRYPMIARSTGTAGLVVLFLSAGHGTVLVPGNSARYTVGAHSETWNMDVFEELLLGEEVVLAVMGSPAAAQDD